MIVKTIFVHFPGIGKDTPVRADATIVVPGLGQVSIEHALSKELCDEIVKCSIAALRLRLGQSLTPANFH